MALYSEILLDAAKNCSLVDDNVYMLENEDAVRYSVYLKNAIAKFNNNPALSFGTEKVLVRTWNKDEFGAFARLVREDDSSLLRPLINENTEVVTTNEPDNQFSFQVPNVSPNNYHGATAPSSLQPISKTRANPHGTAAPMAEIPQRLLKALYNPHGGAPQEYKIVNESQFFLVGRRDLVATYEVRESEGIVRVSQPTTLLLIFDRAIPYHFGIDNDMANAGSQQPSAAFDLLNIYVDLPVSHIPYLTMSTALELAMGLKLEPAFVQQLKEQLSSQEKDLSRNNVREKVFLSYDNRDYARNFWTRRAYN